MSRVAKQRRSSLDEAVKNLPDDEPQRSRVALDMLTQWAERADKSLVLLLDNADLIPGATQQAPLGIA